MKLPVIETKRLELEYSGTNSSLINEIFKDEFGFDINDQSVQFIKEGSVLHIYRDSSYHGSPSYTEHVRTYSYLKKIELYDLLKKIYSLLTELENEQRKKGM